MANLIYRLSKKRLEDKAEILVRFYDGRFEQSGHTHIYVPVKAWNVAERRVMFSTRYYTPEAAKLSEAQKKLDNLRSYLLETYVNTFEPSKTWLQDNVDLFIFPDAAAEAKRIKMLVSTACREYPAAHTITATSAEHYTTIANIIERFGSANYPLYIGSVTHDDLNALVAFMRKEVVTTKNGEERTVQRGRNTIASKLHKLRSVFIWCKSKGMTDTNPFENYDIPEEVYGTPTFLTIQERDTYYHADLPPKLAEARDIFVFQCFIGCRIGDLFGLTTDNITPDGFLQYIQQKRLTSDPITIRVPLTDTAKEIIAKYNRLRIKKRLLPFPTEQTYNERIRAGLRIAGITRNVIVQDSVTLEPVIVPICDIATSHLARRTFTEIMFKATKSERITSSFTGHAKNSKAFERYTTVDDDMKNELIQNLEQKPPTKNPE